MLETPGLEVAVIFEDDAVASSGLDFSRSEISNLANADWDMLLLGYIQRYPTEPTVVRGAVRVTHPFFGLHAYALRRKGAKFLLAHLQYPLSAQLDALIGMLANLHRDEFSIFAPSRGSLFSQLQTTRSTTQSASYDCQLCDHEDSCSADIRERRIQRERLTVAVVAAFLLGLLLAGTFALGYLARQKNTPPRKPTKK
jgi:GR25 family glycosyltransferase involved in LPS biosynthesis